MTSKRTLGEWVTDYPAASKIFHRYGLDFCCGGHQSMEEACIAKGLDPETLSREIASTTVNLKDIRWDLQPVEALVKHILEHYHTPLKTEVPRLIDLARKVERVHGKKPECPVGLAALLTEVQVAFDSHLAKEEQVLFPLILSDARQSARTPIQVMMREHEAHGESLLRIRNLTHKGGLPESACASWRELYRSLAALEIDLMDHIHLENNILFPSVTAEL